MKTKNKYLSILMALLVLVSPLKVKLMPESAFMQFLAPQSVAHYDPQAKIKILWWILNVLDGFRLDVLSTRTIPSFTVSVRSKSGSIFLGTIPSDASGDVLTIQGSKIGIRSLLLKKGMLVEIVPKFDEAEILYLEVYALDPETKRRTSRTPLFTPRFDRSRASLFDNHWEMENGSIPSMTYLWKEAPSEKERSQVIQLASALYQLDVDFTPLEAVLGRNRFACYGDLPFIVSALSNRDKSVKQKFIMDLPGYLTTLYAQERSVESLEKEVFGADMGIELRPLVLIYLMAIQAEKPRPSDTLALRKISNLLFSQLSEVHESEKRRLFSQFFSAMVHLLDYFPLRDFLLLNDELFQQEEIPIQRKIEVLDNLSEFYSYFEYGDDADAELSELTDDPFDTFEELEEYIEGSLFVQRKKISQTKKDEATEEIPPGVHRVTGDTFQGIAIQIEDQVIPVLELRTPTSQLNVDGFIRLLKDQGVTTFIDMKPSPISQSFSTKESRMDVELTLASKGISYIWLGETFNGGNGSSTKARKRVVEIVKEAQGVVCLSSSENGSSQSPVRDVLRLLETTFPLRSPQSQLDLFGETSSPPDPSLSLEIQHILFGHPVEDSI